MSISSSFENFVREFYFKDRAVCDVDAVCFIHSALGGDLHRHCIAYDSDEPASSRSEREVVFLLRQILEGVKHMHDQDYVHLDIKVRSVRPVVLILCLSCSCFLMFVWV